MSMRTLQRNRHRTEIRGDEVDHESDRLVAVRSIVRMGEEDGDSHAATDALLALGVSPEEITAAERNNSDDEALDWPW